MYKLPKDYTHTLNLVFRRKIMWRCTSFQRKLFAFDVLTQPAQQEKTWELQARGVDDVMWPLQNATLKTNQDECEASAQDRYYWSNQMNKRSTTDYWMCCWRWWCNNDGKPTSAHSRGVSNFVTDDSTLSTKMKQKICFHMMGARKKKLVARLHVKK